MTKHNLKQYNHLTLPNNALGQNHELSVKINSDSKDHSKYTLTGEEKNAVLGTFSFEAHLEEKDNQVTGTYCFKYPNDPEFKGRLEGQWTQDKLILSPQEHVAYVEWVLSKKKS